MVSCIIFKPFYKRAIQCHKIPAIGNWQHCYFLKVFLLILIYPLPHFPGLCFFSGLSLHHSNCHGEIPHQLPVMKSHTCPILGWTGCSQTTQPHDSHKPFQPSLASLTPHTPHFLSPCLPTPSQSPNQCPFA